MQLSGQKAVSDGRSTSGRGCQNHMPRLGPEGRCKRPFFNPKVAHAAAQSSIVPHSAAVSLPLTSISAAATPALPELNQLSATQHGQPGRQQQQQHAVPLQQHEHQQQQQHLQHLPVQDLPSGQEEQLQQLQRRRRARSRLFGTADSSTSNQQQHQQPAAWTVTSRSNHENSDSISVASHTSLHTASSRSTSSTSNGTISLAPAWSDNLDRPQHQQRQQDEQQHLQQLQPPQQLQPEQQQQQQRWHYQQQHPQQRAVRTVQWYRDQANRRLTWRIKHAPDLTTLRQLMRQYEGVMNHIHVNALFGRLVKLVASKQLKPREWLSLPGMLPQVLSLVSGTIPECDERSVSNILHGLAVLELDQERELLSRLLAAAESLQLTSFTPQGLANTTWALASLHLNPGPRFTAKLLAASGISMRRFKPVELAQLGWAVAVMRMKVSESWWNAWRAAVVLFFEKLNPQGMSMVLWAAARIAQQQQPLQHMQHHQLPIAQQDAAVQPSSSNSSEERDSSCGDDDSIEPCSWLSAAEAAMQQSIRSYTPHSLSICLWSLARLGHRPSSTFTCTALEAVQLQLRTAAGPGDLAVLLNSLAKLGFRPSRAWLQAHGQGLRRQMAALTVRQVANVLWAHAKVGVRPADKKVLPVLMSKLYYGMQDANARDLANTLYALAVLEVVPDKSWMGIFAAQAEAQMHNFTPQEITNLLWAYAKLGFKPPHLLLIALWETVGVPVSSIESISSVGVTYDVTTTRLSAFKPQELSMLLWALAVLRQAPGKEWWEQFLQASYHKMQTQTPQGLACLIWALSELKMQPPPAWLYHWAAATRAVLDKLNPIDLGQVAAALQSSTFEALWLPKLEALLLDVLDKLAALELKSGAYSKAAVQMLMRMRGSSNSNSSTENGNSSSSSCNQPSSRPNSIVGSRSLQSKLNSRASRFLLQQQPQQQQFSGTSSSMGTSVAAVDVPAAEAATAEAQCLADGEVQQLKRLLQLQADDTLFTGSGSSTLGSGSSHSSSSGSAPAVLL